jgi:hypothetical protein
VNDVDRLIMRHRERTQGRALIAAERARRGNACEGCGATDGLVWHHRDPATKLFKISAGHRAGNRVLARELAKCILVCPTCHHAAHLYLAQSS